MPKKPENLYSFEDIFGPSMGSSKFKAAYLAEMARLMGKKGGKSTSEAKKAAARENGKKNKGKKVCKKK